jgi:hypothetical protein
MRCADAARARGASLQASAGRSTRFLLLEVPGPWGSSALQGDQLGPEVTAYLRKAAAGPDLNVLLIRRPGRRSEAVAGGESRAWALADTSAGVERVLWGSWREPADLLGLDVAAAIPGSASASGPQRVALVCTNGKRDQCCAVRGRPVAAALAADTGWDTWESSHLGGHRFAATMLLLPTGDMFGWLDAESALDVTRRFDAGEIVAAHHRGRSGQPEPVQAALHAAAVSLGDPRRHAIRATSARRLPAGLADGPAGLADRTAGLADGADDAERWEVDVIHQAGPWAGTGYRVQLAGRRLEPAFLSCADDKPKTEIHYEVVAFAPIAPFPAFSASCR